MLGEVVRGADVVPLGVRELALDGIAVLPGTVEWWRRRESNPRP